MLGGVKPSSVGGDGAAPQRVVAALDRDSRSRARRRARSAWRRSGTAAASPSCGAEPDEARRPRRLQPLDRRRDRLLGVVDRDRRVLAHARRGTGRSTTSASASAANAPAASRPLARSHSSADARARRSHDPQPRGASGRTSPMSPSASAKPHATFSASPTRDTRPGPAPRAPARRARSSAAEQQARPARRRRARRRAPSPASSASASSATTISRVLCAWLNPGTWLTSVEEGRARRARSASATHAAGGDRDPLARGGRATSAHGAEHQRQRARVERPRDR